MAAAAFACIRACNVGNDSASSSSSFTSMRAAGRPQNQLILMRHDMAAAPFACIRACNVGNDSPTSSSASFASMRAAERPQNQLVLMRHGESMWNDLKLFTGDVDIPLTEKGINEALAAGKAVSGIDFDIIFTSRLVRSKQTALIAMTQSRYKRVPVIVRGGFHGTGKAGDANRLRLRDAAAKALEHASCLMVPVYADPALNERCYGDLQGLSKEAAARQFGDEQVKLWRRSFDTRPPYGESLQDTAERTVRFFKSTIVPRLDEGRNVLVVAHGNVLRCIISYLSNLSEIEMLRLQVETGLPYGYAYDGSSFAQCCVPPPADSFTDAEEGRIRGLSSLWRKGDIDSLI